MSEIDCIGDLPVKLDMDAFKVAFAEFEARGQQKSAPKDYAFVYGLIAYLKAIAPASRHFPRGDDLLKEIASLFRSKPDWTIAEVKHQVCFDSVRQVYFRLEYLVRRGIIERTGYGKFRAITKASQP